VLRLCPPPPHPPPLLFPPPARPPHRHAAAHPPSRPLPPPRPPPPRALHLRRAPRPPPRPLPPGALAVRAFRSFARRGERVLLLVERAHRLLLSGGGAARCALRPRQYHGVHAYPLERLSHPCSLLAESYHRARAAARALRALADGRADAHVLRHGGG